MKTKKQVQAFLSAFNTATASDCSMISLFCQNLGLLTPKEFPTFSTPGPITAQTFIDWFENSLGGGDFFMDEAHNCFLTAFLDSDLTTIHTCCEMRSDGSVEAKNGIFDINVVTRLDKSTQFSLVSELGRKGWEFDFDTLSLRQKFIPKVNDRVEFAQGDHIGLGVVRDVDTTSGEIELYCYFWYDTKQLGHNMHENGVCDLYSFQFNPQSVVATRRMNRELGKLGKTWNDKLHRIENIECKVPKGEKYWYINDKMKLVQDREKDTPTSHFRYLAGNYFTDYDEALEYLGLMTELLRDRMAK